MDPRARRLMWRIGLAVAAILSVHPAAVAEIQMEERDGVLHVWNVEPSQAVGAPQSAAPQTRRSVARPPTPYGELIRAAAARHGLAPELVEAVVRAESNFNARAVSRKGARGLMQLMPTTAAQLGVRDVFDVRQNIEGGVRHLRHLVDRYKGNLTLALAAYNAGVDAVARHGGVPPYTETQAYVARILRLLQSTGPSVGAGTAETLESEAAGLLRRYETVDGRVVYSNLPMNKLSVTVREMLLGRP
jgi:soluble lytic murein transglycosylase-like protein